MKIIIDDKIPYIRGAFEDVAEVIYLPGSKTTADIAKDADAIVTRTRTICNEKLLKDSTVKFIATATIGYDHIDTDFCDANEIRWTNAPGCNSKSVEQYIASVLMVLAAKFEWKLSEKTIGIVGVGNVGSKVARIAEIFGMKILLNDPPRERTEGREKFVSLDIIQKEADIITLHVPLNLKGEDATYHLADDDFFSGLGRKPVLINSCRGEVTKTEAVKKALKSGDISAFICDCWENEPNLDPDLLALTEIATPHIAGYSKDGKATGTLMSVQAISQHFNLGLENWKPTGVEQPTIPLFEIDGANLTEQEILSKAILHTYDIRKDDADFRKNTALFEQLRGDYPTRREFPAFTINIKNIEEKTIKKLKQLGFKIMKQKADIGLIGLAVMGENLVLNMESKGFTVGVYNRSVEKVDKFMAGRGAGKNFIGAHSVKELCDSLEKPRKVMMLVKAGQAVDDFIEQLIPHLEAGDIIIDGGNTHFPDTIRRTKYVESKGLLFIGTGVSGGEEGALLGPSIMPGGSPAAWPVVKPILQAISAKVEGDVPCCDWVGEGGAGHFVKMVHNGIEYGDMQIINEAYQVMKDLLGMSADEMHEVFKVWNEGDLDSYLIEITRDILAVKDEDGSPLVDKILDTAGQKGTGKWTGVSALDLGVPLTLIGESVFARCLSSQKDLRVQASKVISGPAINFTGDKKQMIDDLKDALFGAKIISYAQGYQLMREAAKEYNWNLNNGGIALMWRGGCIIRSVFLGDIKKAFDKNPDLENLLLDPHFKDIVVKAQAGWRRVCAAALTNGIPAPALTSALCYFDGFRTERLPANLLQAQRDYFGAHTYERIDKPRGEFFHTNWTGRGGDTASTTYVV